MTSTPNVPANADCDLLREVLSRFPPTHSLHPRLADLIKRLVYVVHSQEMDTRVLTALSPVQREELLAHARGALLERLGDGVAADFAPITELPASKDSDIQLRASVLIILPKKD